MLIRIIPACAGNTATASGTRKQDWDHPRLRGEYKLAVKSCGTVRGSSPLARGIRCSNALAAKACRIIPACAGNTRIRSSSGISAQDHPRLRGEYSECGYSFENGIGSSPPARGILCLPENFPTCFGIIPACAGNTGPDFFHQMPPKDHPRLRGEYSAVSQCLLPK